MLIENKRAARTHYPAGLQAIMSIERAQESRRWLAPLTGLTRGATPLYDLPDLAKQLQVARFSVKDESVRSSLGSFKALARRRSTRCAFWRPVVNRTFRS